MKPIAFNKHRWNALPHPTVPRSFKQPACAFASAIGMSRSAFAARFTHIIGVPPIDYLANWRITLAKAALAASTLPMSEIAEIAGYQSVSAFSTGFKRATGFSPKFYAQSLTI